jgi:hypothetical protein
MAYDFSGSAQYLTSGLAASFSAPPLTLGAWAQADSLGSYRGIVQVNVGLPPTLWVTSASGNPLGYSWEATGDEDAAVTGLALTLGTWYYTALTVSSTEANVYLATASSITSWNNTKTHGARTVQTFNIGSAYPGSGFDWEGRIAWPSIWNAVLTPEEITALARGVSPLSVRRSDLMGCWALWGVVTAEGGLVAGNAPITNHSSATPIANNPPMAPFSRRYWIPFPSDEIVAVVNVVRYNKGAAGILDGSIDLLTDTLKVMLVTDSYVVDADHDFASTPSANEISVSGYGRQTLADKIITEEDASDRAIFDATDVTFSALSAGATFTGAVLFKDAGGADSANPLIAYYALTPTATDGRGVVLVWDAAGLLTF